jgi:hypothetical protein
MRPLDGGILAPSLDGCRTWSGDQVALGNQVVLQRQGDRLGPPGYT